jgi:REP element-mobilizing transposase RayT
MPSFALSDILHSWKSYTSKKVNKLIGRSGSFWQAESYNHIVRDDSDLIRCCEYTTGNPVAARLCEAPENWMWSSLYRVPS